MKLLAKFLLGSSLLSLATPAFGQTAAETGEVVTVTGSRLVTTGFQAPTPVTAISADRLQERAPSNIPDALNQLPVFRGSTSNSNSTTWNANSANQGNYLNLRNLGFTRSLIMLDGVRVPATTFTGAVDINTLPQALVDRVEVVTGGASAAYGSDAVVGVVNFILNKKFDGFKSTAQAGISSHEDGASYKLTAAAGTSFDGGRGHIEGSFDHYFNDGIHSIRARQNGGDQVTNFGGRSFASPGVTYFQGRFRLASTGGTIVGGPLNLYQFQPDGSIKPEDLGGTTVDSVNYQTGGSGGFFGGSSLTSRLRTEQLFLRTDYDITDSLRAHVQVNGAESANKFRTRYDDRFAGTANGISIQRDNAYLQPSVLTALGTAQSFGLGRIGNDMPQDIARVITQSGMVNAGLDGDLDLFGNKWTWNTSYTYGAAMLRVHQNENNNQRFYAAIDAVKDGNGKIVCRVTLTNPTLLPGCVPMDILGAGGPSKEAIAYTQGDAGYWAYNSTAIFGGNASGTLFDLPAGPLSMALGAESRHQTLKELSNADPAQASSVNYTGIMGVPNNVLISNFTNIGIAKGANTVNEGFVELGIPLLKDLPLIQSLEFNPAARYTEYSNSGAVMTWKMGATWQVFDDLRLRSTLSRDIAAPTLYQLYAGTQTATANRPDTHVRNPINVGNNIIEQTGGNAALTPEKSTTLVAGFVYSPSFLPGFTTSVDYFHIVIKDAIGAASTAQQLIDCDASNGTSPICAYLIRPFPFSDTRNPQNLLQKSLLVAQNQARVYMEGFDIEMAYRFPVADVLSDWDGDLELHAYATVTTAYGQQASPTVPVVINNNVGVNAQFRSSFEVNYSNDPLNIRVGFRDVGDTIRTSTGLYSMNREPDRWYTDITVSYDLDAFESLNWMGEGVHKQVFATGQNIFGVRPPLVTDCCNPGLQYPTDRVKYDVIGAYYTVGLRVNY